MSSQVDPLWFLREYAQERHGDQFSVETQVVRPGRYCVSLWVFDYTESGVPKDQVWYSGICLSVKEAANSLLDGLVYEEKKRASV